MAGYRLDIPPHVAGVIRHLPPDIERSVKAAMRSLSTDPDAGVPLVGELDGLWKYRVRRFRVVYAIERRHRIIRVLAVGHRRAIYDEVADVLGGRGRSGLPGSRSSPSR